ncbi:NmrA family NAD(P)-binding protein [Fischerella thermalis]|uniref:NmrA family NAD(P)-binding protein n=1 Tax=Fischerella thermalis TaxID=372787 RepID=UPI000CB439AF|nr:hypothetical protein CI593_20275 [Fischerella thermalis CCMEE 5194]
MTSEEVFTEERVLVAGATGGVGQLVVGKLLEKGFKVRVLTRSPSVSICVRFSKIIFHRREEHHVST